MPPELAPAIRGSRGRRFGMVDVLVALGVVLAWCLWAPVPASAHSQLLWTQPSDTSRLLTPPDRVLLKFATDVDVAHSSVEVLAADGSQHRLGPPMSSPQGVMSVGVDGHGPAGTWRVRYTVQSWDRHRFSGELTFAVATSAARATPSEGHTTAYLIGSGVVLAVVVGISGLARRRRERA